VQQIEIPARIRIIIPCAKAAQAADEAEGLETGLALTTLPQTSYPRYSTKEGAKW